MNCSATKIDKTFVLAGHAIITVKNDKGEHYTFKIRKSESDRWGVTYFASLLTGSDNTSDYTYLGIVNQDASVKLTKASKYDDSSTPVRVLRWVLSKIWTDAALPAGYAVNHEGFCARCGKLLTTPTSVAQGYGPECIKIVQAA